MSETKHSTSPAPYASRDDFRRVFHEETDSLYRLAFLLTADSEKAEQCLVSGLEDSVNGSAVFKEWTHSWARRTIFQNAVRTINPRPMEEYNLSHFGRIPGFDPNTSQNHPEIDGPGAAKQQNR
jgi:hypothetical protein